MDELSQLIDDSIRLYHRLRSGVRNQTIERVDTQTVGEFVAEAIRAHLMAGYPPPGYRRWISMKSLDELYKTLLAEYLTIARESLPQHLYREYERLFIESLRSSRVEERE